MKEDKDVVVLLLGQPGLLTLIDDQKVALSPHVNVTNPGEQKSRDGVLRGGREKRWQKIVSVSLGRLGSGRVCVGSVCWMLIKSKKGERRRHEGREESSLTSSPMTPSICPSLAAILRALASAPQVHHPATTGLSRATERVNRPRLKVRCWNLLLLIYIPPHRIQTRPRGFFAAVTAVRAKSRVQNLRGRPNTLALLGMPRVDALAGCVGFLGAGCDGTCGVTAPSLRVPKVSKLAQVIIESSGGFNNS